MVGRSWARPTHSYAIVEVSQSAFDEVLEILNKADYDSAIDGDTIDMHGLALKANPLKPPSNAED